MLLLILALAPAIAIVVYIYIKDKYEREPISFLLKNVVLGASASVLITFLLGAFGNWFLPVSNPMSMLQQFVKAFVVVALVEEFSKYVIVRYYAQRNSEFDEPFDGIVYAVMVAMGFAALENILYVIQYGMSNGFLRAFTAVPAHATFAVLMGYFMGKAKFSKTLKEKIRLNLTGLFTATLFHGVYDFFLYINYIPGLSIGAFLSLAIGLFLARRAIQKHQNSSRFKY